MNDSDIIIEMKEIEDKLKAIKLINEVFGARYKTGSRQAITNVYFTSEDYYLVKKVFPDADLSCVTIVRYDKTGKKVYYDNNINDL